MTAAPSDNPQPAPRKVARRFRLLAATAALVVLAGAACAWWFWLRPAPLVVPDVPLDKADQPVRRAIGAARERVYREPRSAKAWGHLGMVLRAHAYDSQADDCFRKAQQLDPEEPRWPYFLGIQLMLQDTAAALPYLERAVELCEGRDLDSRPMRLRLAEALAQLGRYQDAEQHYRRLVEQEPNDPRTLYGLGVCAAGRNDLPASIRYLSRVTGEPTTRKKALALLASVSLRAGKDKDAAKFNRRAAEAQPDRIWMDPFVKEYMDLEVGRQHELLEVARLEATGHGGAAAQLLSELANDYPDDRTLVALGITLSKGGLFEQAEQALRKSIQLRPDKVQGHYFLCFVLYSQGEQLQEAGQRARADILFRQALDSARRAVALKPDHALAQIYLGLSLQRLGKEKEALAPLRVAVACRPELAAPHLHLGEALARVGQREKALKELELAVQLAAKTDSRPRNALARVRAEGKAPK